MANSLWPLFLALAALMEVGGDAVVRQGLRDGSIALVAGGFAIVGGYAVVVNALEWDFARLLGVYVVFFAVTAVIVARLALGEDVAFSTWAGLALIVAGGVVMQAGATR